jgi:hypothetical protein
VDQELVFRSGRSLADATGSGKGERRRLTCQANQAAATKFAKEETMPPQARHRADTIAADKRADKRFATMTNTARHCTIDGDLNGETAWTEAHLRPASRSGSQVVGQTAGPFDIAADARDEPSSRDALLTGLLVLYPVLATVAAIVAGLFLAGANAA